MHVWDVGFWIALAPGRSCGERSPWSVTFRTVLGTTRVRKTKSKVEAAQTSWLDEGDGNCRPAGEWVPMPLVLKCPET